MHELVLMSMEPYLFRNEFWSTVQKEVEAWKNTSKQTEETQRIDCKLPISIKGMLSSVTAKLSLFQNKIEMVTMVTVKFFNF